MQLIPHLLVRALINTCPRIDVTGEITAILKREKGLKIIQVGANDGKTHDPLFSGLIDNKSHESHHIEAVPNVWKELKSNYSSRHNSSCHNLLITKEGGLIPFYTIKESSAIKKNLPSTWRRIGSIHDNHALKVLPQLNRDDLQITLLKALTPSRFRKQIGLESIDLLHIDCEGADYSILNGFLNDFLPRWILIEHKHLNLKELFLLRVGQFTRGYSCRRNKDDFLFTKRNLLEK